MYVTLHHDLLYLRYVRYVECMSRYTMFLSIQDMEDMQNPISYVKSKNTENQLLVELKTQISKL